MNQRIKRIILLMCGVALVAWIILAVMIFSGKSKQGKSSDLQPTETRVETSATPAPDMVQVWLLEKQYQTYSNGKKKLVCQYGYDGNGRCVACGYDGQDKGYLFQYDEGNHIVIEIQSDYEVYAGEVRKGETFYQSNGRKTKQTEYRKTSAGEYVPFHETVWNEDGHVIQNLYYGEGGSVSSGSVFQYDLNGYVIKEEYMDPKQYTWVVIQYAELDSEGRVTRIYSAENAGEVGVFGISMEIVYHSDGTREETRYIEGEEHFRKLDLNGRETYAEWYDSDSNLKKYQITEYYETEKGITSEQKFYSGDTYVSTFIQIYNPEGELVLQKRIEADGIESVLLERIYDNAGRLVFEKQNSRTVEYIYDENGNLIKESINGPISSGSGISVISREYEYTQITIPRSVAEENDAYYNPALNAYN